MKAEQLILTKDDLHQIEHAFSAIEVKDARYPAALQARVGK